MLCDPKFKQSSPTVVGKKKRCVYCGRSFGIHPNMEKTMIVGIGKSENWNGTLF